MNTIIYTYKKLNHRIYSRETNQKEWIIKSIQSARSFNYNIELYTNDKSFSEGLDLDKVHFIDDDYEIWDSFKLWVLENRTDDYILCDSDVIFNNRIEFEKDKDIYFDGIETQNWNWVYEPTMKFLKSNFIFKKIPFWSYEKQPVYNVGILKINNQSLKEHYIKYWKTLYTEIEPYLDLLDKSFTTPILTQYLLTLLVNKDNYSYQYFTKDGGWPYNNQYYNHFPGFLKFKNSNII